jgi:His-Xaa-Ser system radical SAM maturase HxsB
VTLWGLTLVPMALETDRKFKSVQAYRPETSYHLLPFRFHIVSADREVLVSEVGDYLLCPRGTAARVVQRDVVADEQLYADLLAGFFISDKQVPDLIDVAATRYRTRKAFLDSFTALHIFVVTLRCNHSCHYCQVSRQTEDRRQYDMSRADLHKALALMFRSPSPDITVEFQGGEPLVAFDTIREAVEATLRLNETHGKNVSFVICTNLTTITDEMLDFCKKHRILISTSIDGPAFVHNKNRPANFNSYEIVVDGIARARAVLGDDRVSALMTTSRLSLDYPEDIIDTYLKLGFNHIFLRPIHPYGFAARLKSKHRYDTDEFLRFYKRALLHILSLNNGGVHFVEDYAAIILRKVLTPFPVGFVDLQSPSGMINNVIVYNYDGGVYASDEARMLAETGDDTFRLGSVSDPYEDLFYGTKARQFAEHWSNEGLAGCSECGLHTYCGADPVRHHATHGDLEGYRPSSSYCRKNMEIIRWLFELMDTDSRAEQVFRRWAAGDPA